MTWLQDQSSKCTPYQTLKLITMLFEDDEMFEEVTQKSAKVSCSLKTTPTPETGKTQANKAAGKSRHLFSRSDVKRTQKSTAKPGQNPCCEKPWNELVPQRPLVSKFLLPGCAAQEAAFREQGRFTKGLHKTKPKDVQWELEQETQSIMDIEAVYVCVLESYCLYFQNYLQPKWL
ncbi:hypothetical protein H920_04437 [Fukomys damarensis]|uniref:Uncharacterized protein n=1 Tax=Fukomys damarensis TaxID=885580 RepID=A0A091EFF3_FUKDA|nr:hypothetical protein H920_04437 [Fukomys damarensis]